MYTQCTLCPISEFSRFRFLLPFAREESSTNPQYSNIRSVQYILYCNVMYTQCTLCPISEFSRFLSLLPLAREESSTNPEYSNIPRLDLKGYPISAERRRTNGGGCSAFLGGARPSGCARDAPTGGDRRRRAGRQPERHLAPDGRARPPAGCLK